MNRLFIKKMITAGFFLVFLFTFSFLNIRASYQSLKESIETEGLTLKEHINSIENSINENIYEKYKWVEAYGYLQKLMDKNEESNFEVVKDTEGKLHFTYFANKTNQTMQLTEKVSDFKNQIKDPKTKLLYLLTPDKYIEGYTEFPTGIPYNYNNETADKFLKQLESKKIDSIDLREGILENGIKHSDLFFNTDHHWKIRTAFWGFTQLVNKINEEYNLNLDESNFYTNIDNYNIVEYKDSFIGSMGRKTGKYYTEIDNFSLIYPKFKTDYDFYFENKYSKGTLTGRFEETLIAINPIRKYDEYGIKSDKYFSYLYGNQPFAHVQNKQNTNGLKVLFIKDSLAVPLASFFSTVCSEIYLLDPRYYKEDMLDFINNTELDFVFISFSPQNLVDSFFEFRGK